MAGPAYNSPVLDDFDRSNGSVGSNWTQGEQRPVDLLAIEDRLLTLPWTQVDRPSGDLASWGLPAAGEGSEG